MPLQEGKRRNVNHINFGFVLPSFCQDALEVHGPQHKHELLPHGMANVEGIPTKPLKKNSRHKWVKVNTMLSHRDLCDLCRTPLADFLDRVPLWPHSGHHTGLESIERLPLKSSKMLANPQLAGTKSLELATPLVQSPHDVLKNNIGRLTKRSKFEKCGRSQSNHPRAKDPAVLGCCSLACSCLADLVRQGTQQKTGSTSSTTTRGRQMSSATMSTTLWASSFWAKPQDDF